MSKDTSTKQKEGVKTTTITDGTTTKRLFNGEWTEEIMLPKTQLDFLKENCDEMSALDKLFTFLFKHWRCALGISRDCETEVCKAKEGDEECDLRDQMINVFDELSDQCKGDPLKVMFAIATMRERLQPDIMFNMYLFEICNLCNKIVTQDKREKGE
jgi:hypothetical protein